MNDNYTISYKYVRLDKRNKFISNVFEISTNVFEFNYMIINSKDYSEDYSEYIFNITYGLSNRTIMFKEHFALILE